MKVLHLISGGDTGGAKTHVHLLLSNLSKSIDITMVCFTEGDFSREAAEKGIRTIVIPGNNIPRTLNSLKSLIKDEGFDIIHCHGSRGNLMGALLRRATHLPVLTTIHSDYRLDYMGRPLAAVTYGTMNRWALRRIRYRVAVSDTMRDELSSRGFDCNTTFTIYNGIDFNRQCRKYDSSAFYSRIGADINPGDIVVGAAARLDPVKDLSTLIRGFAFAKKSVPHLKLIIAGDGPDLGALSALSQNLGVKDDVYFAGWLTDMDEFYSSIDINALTSISETFPYAITEGAFHSLATVSTNVGGIPALVKNGITGYLFTPGNYESLGHYLALLGGNAALRLKLGKAIRDRASREFSTETTCRRQLLIYDEILRREGLLNRGIKRDGVLICGAYGMGNAGDEAVLKAIIGEMRDINPLIPLTVLSRNPPETRRSHRVNSVYTFNFPKFLSLMKRTSLYINGGGSLIQDITSRRSLWYYLFTLSAAKRRGCKVMMYGCGIGPVIYDSDRHFAGRVINSSVDAITLRESQSRSELESLGVSVPEISVASDPALTLAPAGDDEIDSQFLACGMDPRGKYIAFCLRSWKGFDGKIDDIAGCARYAYEKYALTPVFISINHLDDGLAADLVTACLDIPHFSIREPMNSELTIGVLSKMRAVVSMRLHGLIFSAGQGIPLIAISYDPKVTAFMDNVGQSSCINLDDVSAPSLCGILDNVMGRSTDELSESVAKLRAVESRNSALARKLLCQD